MYTLQHSTWQLCVHLKIYTFCYVLDLIILSKPGFKVNMNLRVTLGRKGSLKREDICLIMVDLCCMAETDTIL